MTFRLRWLLLGVPLLLAVLLAVAWFALDAWLESAGGRHAIERVLESQSGQAVRLAGEFEVVILPVPGVSGTNLELHDVETGGIVVRGGRYRVALALRPLLSKRLNVERLVIGDIRFGPGNGDGFAVDELLISGFAAGQPADFRLDLGPYGEAAGQFTWRPEWNTLDLNVAWGGFLLPSLSLRVSALFADSGLWFETIGLVADGQALNGSGCFRTGDAGGLDLDLQAARLDLDALKFTLPEGSGEPAALGVPLDLRLAVDTLVQGDTLARGVVLELGNEPDCDGIAPPAAGGMRRTGKALQ